MYLWRLSGIGYAERFDGGYGLLQDGRWNSKGRRVTYCATGPALCVLERLVHIKDVSGVPDNNMLVQYDAPDEIALEARVVDDLPSGWQFDEDATRSIGDAWLDGRLAPLLTVPSVVVPVTDTDDRNVLINHRHPDAARISIARVEPFEFDPRLFAFG